MPWFFVFTTDLTGFFMAFCVNRILLSPLSFWTIAARGWIVDEDAFTNADKGKVLRREALFSSTSAAAAKVGGMVALNKSWFYPSTKKRVFCTDSNWYLISCPGIFVSILLAGMSIAGMNTELVQECEEESVFSELDECSAGASVRVEGGVSIDRQPDSAILYIRCMYMIVMPIFNVLCFIMIRRFPIKVRFDTGFMLFLYYYCDTNDEFDPKNDRF